MGVAMRYGLAMAVAVPGTVLAHELGHAAAAVAVGFADVRLHAAHVSFDSAAHTDRERLLVTAAGPLATAGLVFGAAAWLWRRGPHPGAVAVALAAPQRSFASALYLAGAWVERPWVRPNDESRLAALSGVPTWVWAVAGVAVLAAGAAAGGRALARLDRAARGRALAGLGVGVAAGWLLQLTAVRWLLP